MKVALVCPYDLSRRGGVQDQALNLARWLRRDGHEAWVVGPGEGPEEAVSVGEVTVIPANGAETPVTLQRGTTRRVVEATDGADVVHIHEPLMPAVSLAATRHVTLPTVGTCHADAPAWARLAHRAAKRSLRRLDAVTAVSPVAARSIDGVVPYHLVPNGLDTEDYVPGEKVPGRVVFLGRDDPRKGLEVYYQAAAIIAARRPEADLLAAGPGSPPPSDHVRHLGEVGGTEKRELLASAEVFVAPNLGGESFGLIVAEAMASGCAVIASALPAFVYVLGDAGVLVPPGDSGALASEVERMLRDSEVRGQNQKAARERAARFDRRHVVDGYLAVYAAALAGADRS